MVRKALQTCQERGIYTFRISKKSIILCRLRHAIIFPLFVSLSLSWSLFYYFICIVVVFIILLIILLSFVRVRVNSIRVVVVVVYGQGQYVFYHLSCRFSLGSNERKSVLFFFFLFFDNLEIEILNFLTVYSVVGG